jgi:hypothetical protein
MHTPLQLWSVLKIVLALVTATYLRACGSSQSESADWKWSQIGVSAVAPRTLGVNSFLWQAALDTFSFLPVVKADPFGGVIISDWYSPPSSPNERMKVMIYIMDRALRAEGLKVKVFRQVRSGAEWQNVQATPELDRKLKDAILTRARQLRLGARERTGS